MNSQLLKNTIFISLLGHLAVFSIFSFSFGDRIPKADYATISFWGEILRSSDLKLSPGISQDLIKGEKFSHRYIRGLFMQKTNLALLDKLDKKYYSESNPYLKPPVIPVFNKDKIIFRQKMTQMPPSKKRKEPVIMFYPILPQHFLLYFNDRQTVHIELMFNIVSSGRANSIAIKRKISSGNLEADLLARRYISHYLFREQSRFGLNKWQTVRIDLSARDIKND